MLLFILIESILNFHTINYLASPNLFAIIFNIKTFLIIITIIEELLC